MPKKRYVVHCVQSRAGEFEFNCATQSHICTSLKQARDIIENRTDPEDNDGPELAYVIYEITLTKVKA